MSWRWKHADGSQAQLTRLARKARVLHIDGHGVASPTRPEQSALMLSPLADGENHALLHAPEIAALDLPGTLVVTSATEHDLGNARGNAATLGLDRAFMLAGASAVVSSLWDTDDKAAAMLVETMLDELERGHPLDVALATAMQAVRERPGWADPRYWSGFRVTGGGWR